jgi:hypothetical protein
MRSATSTLQMLPRDHPEYAIRPVRDTGDRYVPA